MTEETAKVYSLRAFAEAIGVTTATIKKHIKAGRVKATLTLSGYEIPESEVESLKKYIGDRPKPIPPQKQPKQPIVPDKPVTVETFEQMPPEQLVQPEQPIQPEQPVQPEQQVQPEQPIQPERLNKKVEDIHDDPTKPATIVEKRATSRGWWY